MSAAVRLFCLPYAGGSARIFQDWRDDLPDFVDVRPLELPGRGLRFSEPPQDRLETVVTDLLETVSAEDDLPLAIFGYSYGALLGFELAWRLERRRGTGPVCLIVAAARAPIWPGPLNRLGDLPDAQLLEGLRLMNGTPRELLEHRQLMEIMLPVVRADFTAAERYQYRPGPLPSCPITAFCGTDDPVVSRTSMEAWAECTASDFALHELPGDHFFLRSAREPLLRRLARTLSSLSEVS
ncbi:thioesterase II family protein [Nonomuraea sp. NPDC048826]|uniref:thioesterase II family protein n=1 Tax=Nonomuraea sp. NPDC048826 TaxID=3364347 RepID=UPI003717D164